MDTNLIEMISRASSLCGFASSIPENEVITDNWIRRLKEYAVQCETAIEALVESIESKHVKINSHEDDAIKTKKWVPFFFESNRFFRTIEGPEDWQRLRNAYPEFTDEKLLESKETTYKGARSPEDRQLRPEYGLRFECDGEPLSAFFERNGMSL